MLNSLLTAAARTPTRLVRAGLWAFFAGAAALLASALAQVAAPGGPGLAERLPDWPTWFVPESPAGFAAATTLVAWGVWAMARGLQQARRSRGAR